ncbi:hypothetical protein DMB90_10970 [Raoultella planticola]|uniref:Uncharacterized protein n=1 Tax=Raoultella planticola TaxID=575 RepID=A0A5P6A9S1_RAOPL|nr:hypothetical protein DMB90_10970 [Raoultella planticola]
MVISPARHAHLQRGDVDNRAGQFATEQTLDASFSAFLNQEGSLKALSAMTLNGGTLDNARGVVGAGGALNIGVTTLDNRRVPCSAAQTPCSTPTGWTTRAANWRRAGADL